jgi:hypothetical protein
MASGAIANRWPLDLQQPGPIDNRPQITNPHYMYGGKDRRRYMPQALRRKLKWHSAIWARVCQRALMIGLPDVSPNLSNGHNQPQQQRMPRLTGPDSPPKGPFSSAFFFPICFGP